MSQERATPTQWDVLTAELRSYREQQKQTWGDVDNALIGRYLAGEVTDEERRTVETACKNHPELRKLTDIVLDVLNEFQPNSSETPAPPPRLLSFTDHRQNRRPFLSRVRERGVLVAAACVLLALGVALWKVPGSAPVTHVAGLRGPEVAHLSHSTEMPVDDEFPIRTEADLTIKAASAVDSVASPPVDDIAKVADWTEKRLRAPRATSSRPGVRSGGGMMAPAPGRPAVSAKKGQPNKGHTFARKDKRATPQELKRAAPYLARGLCQDVKPALQDRCGKALIRMAPYADDAVPFLKRALEQPASPKQQKIIVEVLRNLGPAANEAAPVLARLADRGPADVRFEAREALRCVCVGINDQARVLTPEACRRLNDHAARLSRQHHVYFTAQTYRRQTDGKIQTYALQSLPANGRGLAVFICAESQAVKVTLTPDLAGKDTQLNALALQTIIQRHLRDKTPEKGLEQAVEMVERSLARR